MAFEIQSPAFANGEVIPRLFTCEGDDISPHLTWTEAPAGTQSFALFCNDPDAPGGTWWHWAAFDIPTDHAGLRAAVWDEAEYAPVVRAETPHTVAVRAGAQHAAAAPAKIAVPPAAETTYALAVAGGAAIDTVAGLTTGFAADTVVRACLSRCPAKDTPSTRIARHALDGVAGGIDDVQSAEELALDYSQTVLPPKKYILPPRETLFRFEGTNLEAVVAESDRLTVALGVHTCDMHAIHLLDRVHDQGYPDQHYQARRENHDRAQFRKRRQIYKITQTR